MMADDPKKRGRDRELVSMQEHELAYLMRTAKVSRQKAKEAIEKAGPSREKVMAYLKENS
jgi:DNA-directed RNA polymerase subunit F